MNNPRLAYKYGIDADYPPAWIGTDLVIEDVVEGIEQQLIKINGFNLLEMKSDDIIEKLNLSENRRNSNNPNYTNEDKSLFFIKQQSGAISIQVEDIQKIAVDLDTVSLQGLDLNSFKELFPGAYMFRNLYGVQETMHIAERDSVKTIDYVFLWSLAETEGQPQITGRFDLTFVNGVPLKAYFFSIL
ncbi:hypothetical protein GCM10008106_15190 [Mongoliitalea lutea]|uniref:Uncharacterized protein n=1 Tax=Mongoliitalea lutea TaxID=849756 RepID=A0A8J3CWH7_9BACT|nr:hypothetical protein GCM10008106_15190 [Mongoliitalea lutea]